jgi:hypothetical protein
LGCANLHPSDRLDFILENGRLYVQPADVDVRSLSGLLYKPDRKPVALDEMETDFSDYLIGTTNQQAGCSETATLNAKLHGVEGFCVL